jgi:hypothetical protein
MHVYVIDDDRMYCDLIDEVYASLEAAQDGIQRLYPDTYLEQVSETCWKFMRRSETCSYFFGLWVRRRKVKGLNEVTIE